MNDLFRYGLALAGLGFLLLGPADERDTKPDRKPEVVEKYDGYLTDLHDISREMDEADRENMSGGFLAGGEMVDADKKGVISDTQKAQDYVVALLTFDYQGSRPPKQSYPEVSEEIGELLEKELGDDLEPLSDREKDSFANLLKEIGRAVR